MANMNPKAYNQDHSPTQPHVSQHSPSSANAANPENMAQKIERYRLEHMIRDPTTQLPVYAKDIYGYNDFFDAPVLPGGRHYQSPDVSERLVRERRKKYVDSIKALHDELNVVLEFTFGRNNETYVMQMLGYIGSYLKQVNMQAWEHASGVYALMEREINTLTQAEDQQWRGHNSKMENFRAQHSDVNGKWADPRTLQGPTAGKTSQEICHMHTTNAKRGMCACPKPQLPAPQPPRPHQNAQQRGTPQQQRPTGQNTIPQSYIPPRIPPSQPPPQPRRQPWGPSIQQPPSRPTPPPPSPSPQLNPPKKRTAIDLTDDDAIIKASPGLHQAKKPRTETPPPQPIRQTDGNFMNTYGPGVPPTYLQAPTPASQVNAMSARGIISYPPNMPSPLPRPPQGLPQSTPDPRMMPKNRSPPSRTVIPQIPASPSPPKAGPPSYHSPAVTPVLPQPTLAVASAPAPPPQTVAVPKPSTPSPPSQVPTPASAAGSPSSSSANGKAVYIGVDFTMIVKNGTSQLLKGFQVWSNGAIVDCRKAGMFKTFKLADFLNTWDTGHGENEGMKADRDKCVAWLKHAFGEWKKKNSPSP